MQVRESDSLINKFFNGTLAQLQEEYYNKEECDLPEEADNEFLHERTHCKQSNLHESWSSDNTIFERVKAMVMKKKQQPKREISLQQKSQMIIDDTAQFRILKQKMQSSGMMTNEGIQQLLPSLVDSQYREIIERKKREEKINQVQNRNSKRQSMNLRCYLDNTPCMSQPSKISSQQQFNLFPTLFSVEFGSMCKAARGA